MNELKYGEVSGYHRATFDHISRKTLIERVCQVISDNFAENVGIAVSGLSGILVGVPAAEKLNRGFCIVRKSNEDSHGLKVEGHTISKYVIVDDLISEGGTIEYILDQMHKFRGIYCEGIVLYNSARNDENYGNIRIVRA